MDGNFSPAEIEFILKAARECGVARLKVGNFSVSFLHPEPKAKDAAAPSPEEQKAAIEFQNEAFLENERRIREEQLSQLRLSDPEMYEELVSRGELENVGQKSDGIDA